MCIKVEKINGKQNIDFVYDVSLDGTLVNAFGMNVISNTDGFNFEKPKKFRYTKEHPYIGKGFNRESKAGKEYYETEADVAEYNDTILCKCYNGATENLSGLGIDEEIRASINISRKNYLDLKKMVPSRRSETRLSQGKCLVTCRSSLTRLVTCSLTVTDIIS